MSQCQAKVAEPPHYLHEHQCLRNATTTLQIDSRDIQLCKQHQRIARETKRLRIVKPIQDHLA
jgi:hypothetical protein